MLLAATAAPGGPDVDERHLACVIRRPDDTLRFRQRSHFERRRLFAEKRRRQFTRIVEQAERKHDDQQQEDDNRDRETHQAVSATASPAGDSALAIR